MCSSAQQIPLNASWQILLAMHRSISHETGEHLACAAHACMLLFWPSKPSSVADLAFPCRRSQWPRRSSQPSARRWATWQP